MSGGFDEFLSFVGGDKSKKDVKQSIFFDEEENAAALAQEEEKEKDAMMKSSHQPMKKWFTANEAALKEKFGSFPLFWQDLKKWEHFKIVHKTYMMVVEGGYSTADALLANTQDSGEAPVKKRRKKSRWADAESVEQEDPITEPKARKKKSRWSENPDPEPAAPVQATPNASTGLTSTQMQTIVLRAQLDKIGQQLITVVEDAARIDKDPNRPASPPPQYDANGKRTNLREARMRKDLEEKRMEITAQLIKLNPQFRPVQTNSFYRERFTRKIYIPVEEYPGYNFVGIIIGPRGNTQKRLEKETNCRIAIRGKGAVKEGSKAKKLDVDENDDLHILLTAEDPSALDVGEKEMRKLLIPCEDMQNPHKQRQLRELALINGTLRDDDYCTICAEKGHRQWECPNREQNFKRVEVKCLICGDASHPTSDCTQKEKTPEEAAAMDKEYMSFMEELGEKPVPGSSSSTAAPAASTSATASAAATAAGAPAIGSTPGTAYPCAVAPSPMAMYGYAAPYYQQQYYPQQYWQQQQHYGYTPTAGAPAAPVVTTPWPPQPGYTSSTAAPAPPVVPTPWPPQPPSYNSQQTAAQVPPPPPPPPAPVSTSAPPTVSSAQSSYDQFLSSVQ